MHGILKARRMFQARIPSEENQEAENPRSMGDDGSTPPISGLRWQYTTENLAVSLCEIQRGNSS